MKLLPCPFCGSQASEPNEHGEIFDDQWSVTEYRLSPRWSLRADIDGLAVPGAPGRAVDAGLKLTWNAPDGTYFGVGVRTLEGGADIPRLYNFAWINYALVTVGRRL